MKKTILLISLIILTITTVKAQEKIQFGVKGGVNLTTMTADILYDKEYKTGFHIGVVAEIPFGSKFSLQPEILYSTHGVKGNVLLLYVPFPGAPVPPPLSGEFKLNYIQVPVLAKIYLIKNFSLELGPSFNFLVLDEENYGTVSHTDIGSKFEFSGILGLSYKLKSGLFGSVRYVNGFTVALDREYYDENAKNIGFQLGVGFMF
ncbi:MAG: PorT family protein [Flavobacterium sp.]|nr:PorT family protein [Flavobacterium sp.]